MREMDSIAAVGHRAGPLPETKGRKIESLGAQAMQRQARKERRFTESYVMRDVMSDVVRDDERALLTVSLLCLRGSFGQPGTS